MTETRAVVAEGVEPDVAAPPRPPSRWVWLAIGLVVGFGLALVVLTRTAATEGVAETGTTLAAPQVAVVGVGDYVTGFEDDLVVVAVGDDQNLMKLSWPAHDEPTNTLLAAAADSVVEIDPSGKWMAIGSPVGADGESFLTVGTNTSNVALDSSSTGFSWHDSTPASLAFTRSDGAGWRLMTAQPPSLPRTVDVPSELVGGTLVAFGDWGYALQRPEGAAIVSGGESWLAIPGTVLDSHPDVGFVVLDDEIRGVSHSQEPFDIKGSFVQLEPTGAAISPDGTKVAVTGAKGVKVAPFGDSGEVTEMYTTAAPRSVAWTFDSRFVVVPMVRGVAVIDTVQGGVPVALLESLQVIAVGTVPSGDAADTLQPWQR